MSMDAATLDEAGRYDRSGYREYRCAAERDRAGEQIFLKAATKKSRPLTFR